MDLYLLMRARHGGALFLARHGGLRAAEAEVDPGRSA